MGQKKRKNRQEKKTPFQPDAREETKTPKSEEEKSNKDLSEEANNKKIIEDSDENNSISSCTFRE